MAWVERIAHREQDRLIPVLWHGELLLEEPALDRCERERPGDEPLLRQRQRCQLRHSRKAGDGLVLEDLAWAELQAGLAGAGDDLNTEDRVAAEREEVIVDADLGDAEHLLPDRGQAVLEGRSWRGKAAIERWTRSI